jgi:hypothetical protein
MFVRQDQKADIDLPFATIAFDFLVFVLWKKKKNLCHHRVATYIGTCTTPLQNIHEQGHCELLKITKA